MGIDKTRRLAAILVMMWAFILPARVGADIFTGTVSYSYDERGRLSVADYGGDNWMTYAYDEAGNLNQVIIMQYPFSVVKTGTGSGTVTSTDGAVDCGEDCSELYGSGTEVTLTAEAAAGSVFMGWEGGGCSGTGGDCVITTGLDPITVTATFDEQHSLTTSVTANGYCTATITSDPAGIDCGSDCEEIYFENTEVELTVVPSDDCEVNYWERSCSVYGGCEVSYLNTDRTMVSVMMDGEASVRVVVDPPEKLLTIEETGSGDGSVSVSPDSLYCGIDCEDILYYKATEITLTATPETGSFFAGWSGDGCSGTDPVCVTTIMDDMNVTAEFQSHDKSITVRKVGTGSGTVTSLAGDIDCGTDCSELYDVDTAVSLSASPDAGSRFVGWTGEGCAGSNGCDLTVDSNMTVRALFASELYALTVEPQGEGGGAVTSSDGLIDCGADCSESYAPESVVTLSAVADSESAFTGWSGGSCSGTGDCQVTLSSARSVSARFEPAEATLTVERFGPGTGTVTSDPAGIDCGADCSASFALDTELTLIAISDAGTIFQGWFGGGCSGTGTCITTVEKSETVHALFALDGGDLFVDGSSGDDANSGLSWNEAKASIQAAVDSADGTATLTIHVKEGEYVGQLVLPSHVNLFGGYPQRLGGTDTGFRDPLNAPTTIDGNWAQSAISVSSDGIDRQDITINGFTIKGGGSYGPLAVEAGFAGLTFSDNLVTGNDYGMIWFDGPARNMNISGNTFTGNLSASGVEFYDISDTVNLSGNTIRETAGTEIWGGIHFYDDAAWIRAGNNAISGSALGDDYIGIVFWYTASDFVLEENTISDLPGGGVGLQFWEDINRGEISGNALLGLPYRGINFFGPAADLVIKDNTLDSISGYDNGIVFWYESVNILLEGNSLSNLEGGGNGMAFWDSAEQIRISANRFHDLRGYASGIYFYYPADRVEVDNNLFHHFSDDPVKDEVLSWAGIIFKDPAGEVSIHDNELRDFVSAATQESYLGIIVTGDSRAVSISGNLLLDMSGFSHDGIVFTKPFNSNGSTAYPLYGGLVEKNILASISPEGEGPAGIILDKVSFDSKVENNIVDHARTGIAAYHGSGILIGNNTLRGNKIGVLEEGVDTTFQNLVVTGSSEAGFRFGDEAVPAAILHNNAYDNLVSYEGVDDPAGTNGNISSDPLYLAPDFGNLKPLAGSAVIDSGVSSLAPELDLAAQGRFDDPLTADTGTGALTYYDTGAYEYLPLIDPWYLLTVIKDGSGSGTVTDTGGDIRCGYLCAAPYEEGATVTLEAAVDEGSVFTGWSGGGCSGLGSCTVAMGEEHQVTATFTAVDLLAEALDAPDLDWSTGGDFGWTSQPSATGDGDMARSGPIDNNQSSWLETAVSGPGSVSFFWKISSELGYDTLSFMIDGEVAAMASGEVDWQQRSFVIEDGEHTLRWEYRKNASDSAGLDSAWLDGVEICTGSFLIDPASAFFDFAGGTGTVSVTGPAGSCWFATSNVPWAAVTSGDHGSGNGMVEYSVEPGSSRYGTLTIAGKTFALAQQSIFDMEFNYPDGLVHYNGGADFSDYGYRVVIQPDGKIVVAGEVYNDFTGEENSLLLRYTPNGWLDPDFGVNGAAVYQGPAAGWDWLEDLAIQPDGKIVAVGSSHDGTGNYDVLVLRYDEDGELDPDFGVGGVVLYNGPADRDDHGWGVALQADGRIVVSGRSHNGNNNDVLLLRLLPDGSLDSGFGSGGAVTYNNESNRNDWGNAVAVDREGRIVVAGGSNRLEGYYLSDDLLILRYLADGSPDMSFADGGVMIYRGPYGSEWANSVAIDRQNRIVVAGLGTMTGGSDDVLLLRALESGGLDPLFGDNGLSLVDGAARGDDFASDLLIQPDGRIVVAGVVNNGSNNDIGVMRFSADGLLDTTFVGNGLFTYDGSGDEYWPGIALQDDCGLVVAGGSFHGADLEDVVVMRLSDGDRCRPKSDFDEDDDIDAADLAWFRYYYSLDQGMVPVGSDSPADLNGDWLVDEEDLEVFAEDFGLLP